MRIWYESFFGMICSLSCPSASLTFVAPLPLILSCHFEVSRIKIEAGGFLGMLGCYQGLSCLPGGLCLCKCASDMLTCDVLDHEESDIAFEDRRCLNGRKLTTMPTV